MRYREIVGGLKEASKRKETPAEKFIKHVEANPRSRDCELEGCHG